ncbi:MAG: protease complex subunit PrcB family protein [Gemmatimonadales bacterium]
MIARPLALVLLIVALTGCGAGRSIRVSEGDSTASEPVALAPTPAQEPASAPAPQSDTASAAAAPSEQGYAPYGNNRTLDIRRIGQWTRTGIGESRRLVIRDANGWAQFWSELGVGLQPAVDFNRDVVIAVAAGQRPTGGYEIVIDRVTQSDGQLTVEVVERTPGPNCMTTASLTQPVDVVVVPAADAKSPTFLERKEIRGCR